MQLPTPPRLVYRLASKLVDAFNGDNNHDMATNGETRFARLMLPHAQVALDVGANVGDWTALALSINPQLAVYAFEPHAHAFRLLSDRTWPAAVHLHPLALGADDGDRTLFVFGQGCGGNTLHARTGAPDRHQAEESVRVRTLDGVCAELGIERIDFLKIDVEGHELAVLRGAERMLTEGRIGVVQFEYGGCYLDARTHLRDVWELLHATRPDWAFFKIFPARLEPVLEYKQTLETFRYSNWAALSPQWVQKLTSKDSAR
jgi:FkbM family methyltransferase